MSDEWQGLMLPELVDLLQPVPEPDLISMMPQTAGWLWIAAFLAGCLLIAARQAWRYWRTNAYRRAALRELQTASGDPAALAHLLRRTALNAYPRDAVASLHGTDWLAFLDKSYGGRDFSNGAGTALNRLTYAEKPNSSDAELKLLVERWIKTHRKVTA